MSDMSALEAAAKILSDVDWLLEHHPASKEPKPGKPAGSGYGPLLRAGTALCYTAWEVYVEEALIETVEWLLENLQPQELPQAMRDWVAKERPDPWAFVGDSWRSEVLRLARNKVEGDVQGRYGFNTASVHNVTSLYREILGFDPLRGISWQKKVNAAVRADISLLVQVRGEIVHKGTTPGALNLGEVRGWADFVRRLTEKFDGRLVKFRSGLTSGGRK